MILPQGPFTVVYADPPWSYRDKCSAGKRGASFKYATMRDAELLELPVDRIAAPDSMLFLWATMPRLPFAFDVLKAWGFGYRTVAFTWVKTRSQGRLHVGMGHYTRANAELCLLGVRGRPQRVSAAVRSVVISELREHSRKPDEVRDRIIDLAGDVPRVELFARQTSPGWRSWGNELLEDAHA